MHITEFTTLDGSPALHITTSHDMGQDIAYVTKHETHYELNLRDPLHWTPRGRNITRKTLVGAQTALDRHLTSIGETELIQISI